MLRCVDTDLKKKPPVVNVKEKKVLRVNMKTNSNQEHLKETKREKNCWSVAPNLQPLQKLQGWNVTGEVAWLFLLQVYPKRARYSLGGTSDSKQASSLNVNGEKALSQPHLIAN